MIKRPHFEALLLMILSTLTMTFIMIVINFGYSDPAFMFKWMTTWVICFPIVIVVSIIAKVISSKVADVVYK